MATYANIRFVGEAGHWEIHTSSYGVFSRSALLIVNLKVASGKERKGRRSIERSKRGHLPSDTRLVFT